MKDVQDLIWDYLDGRCPEADAARVEAALSNDPDFKQVFLMSRRLHEQLQGMETDAPSLRFTQNLMDSLPVKKVGRSVRYTTLLSSRWIWAYSIGLSVLAFISLWILPAATTSNVGQMGWLASGLDRLTTLSASLPYSVSLLIAAIVLSLAVWLPLDRWLKRKFIPAHSTP